MDWYAMSDKTIVSEIGMRLKQLRLNRNISQQELAEKSGVHRVTLSKIERGQKMTLLSLIQILRGLDSLNSLDHIVPEKQISPIQLAKLRGKQRKRASRRNDATNTEVDQW